jgi:hypothetical protein
MNLTDPYSIIVVNDFDSVTSVKLITVATLTEVCGFCIEFDKTSKKLIPEMKGSYNTNFYKIDFKVLACFHWST